jgi:hypothetical protein
MFRGVRATRILLALPLIFATVYYPTVPREATLVIAILSYNRTRYLLPDYLHARYREARFHLLEISFLYSPRGLWR